MSRTKSMLLVALCSCSAAPGTPSAAKRPAPELKVWGSLRELMHEGRTESRVAIASVIATPHVYAVGAVAGMRGEITVVDSTAWLALGDRAAGRAAVGAADEGAALLVASSVASWSRAPIGEDIPFADLDQRIESLARAAGIDVDQAFPFLIEGELTDVQWHVLKGPPSSPATPHDHADNAVRGEQATMTGTLVGFFSRHHQGVFTHMGRNVHAHVVSPTAAIAAHADQVSVRASSILALPR